MADDVMGARITPESLPASSDPDRGPRWADPSARLSLPARPATRTEDIGYPPESGGPADAVRAEPPTITARVANLRAEARAGRLSVWTALTLLAEEEARHAMAETECAALRTEVKQLLGLLTRLVSAQRCLAQIWGDGRYVPCRECKVCDAAAAVGFVPDDLYWCRP